MPIQVMDMAKMAREEGKRKVIFNTNRFHAWLHVYPRPGDADDMHCIMRIKRFTSSKANARCMFLMVESRS